MPKHVQLHSEIGPKGFVLLAVSNETKAVLQKFVDDNKINYRVPVDAGGRIAQAYSGNGVPRSWLIDPDGNVVWKGHPGSVPMNQVEELLGKVRSKELREVDRAVQSAAKDFAAGKYADAAKKAARIAQDESASEEARADAAYVLEEVEKLATAELASAEALVGRRRYLDALEILSELERGFRGHPTGDAAKARSRELNADREIKNEIVAAQYVQALRQKESKATRDKDRQALANDYRAVARKYAGTLAAEEAEARAKALSGG